MIDASTRLDHLILVTIYSTIGKDIIVPLFSFSIVAIDSVQYNIP